MPVAEMEIFIEEMVGCAHALGLQIDITVLEENAATVTSERAASQETIVETEMMCVDEVEALKLARLSERVHLR
jgi:hypothetical protein